MPTLQFQYPEKPEPPGDRRWLRSRSRRLLAAIGGIARDNCKPCVRVAFPLAACPGAGDSAFKIGIAAQAVGKRRQHPLALLHVDGFGRDCSLGRGPEFLE